MQKDVASPVIKWYTYTTCTWPDADPSSYGFEVAEYFYKEGADTDLTLSGTFPDAASITTIIEDTVPNAHASDRRLASEDL